MKETFTLTCPISAIQTMNEIKQDDKMPKSLTHDKSLKSFVNQLIEMTCSNK